jgi:hypothetical protein
MSGGRIRLCMCPHTTICVSSYGSICVLALICVSSCYSLPNMPAFPLSAKSLSEVLKYLTLSTADYASLSTVGEIGTKIPNKQQVEQGLHEESMSLASSKPSKSSKNQNSAPANTANGASYASAGGPPAAPTSGPHSRRGSTGRDAGGARATLSKEFGCQACIRDVKGRTVQASGVASSGSGDGAGGRDDVAGLSSI